MDRLICPEPDRDLKRRPLGHKSSGKSVGQVQRWLGLDVTEYFNKRAYDCPPLDDPMPFPELDPPPLPRPDPIAWGGIGIGAAFLLAMLAYWWL